MTKYEISRDEWYDSFKDIENLSQEDRDKIFKLRDEIDLERKDWKYKTNCYAYALGIDKTDDEILPASFVPGILGASIRGIDIETLKGMTLNEKIFLDLDSLKIDYSTNALFKSSPCKIEDGYLTWVIAAYERLGDYYDNHFLRKDENGIWSHKIGYSDVINTDDYGDLLFDISGNKFGFNNEMYEEYDFYGSYKLKLRR